jgi:hypothetical protein
MTVLITLTTAGTDSGPFDLYSNLDGYTSAFESGVSKSALLAGYSSALVPDFTTTVRVKSNGVCTNYVDILLESTTTTTTTMAVMCMEISIDVSTNCPDQDYALIQYTDCEGSIRTVETNPGELLTFCMLNYPAPVYLCGTGDFQYGDVCTTTTTTTTL